MSNIHKYLIVKNKINKCSGLLNNCFTMLMSCSVSLATKHVYLSNEPYIVRHFLIELYPLKLSYYLFMISLDKCYGNFNAADDLSTNLCIPGKKKHLNVKVSKMMTRLTES